MLVLIGIERVVAGSAVLALLSTAFPWFPDLLLTSIAAFVI